MALTKIITDTIDLSSDTTALTMPKGTTAERPGAQLSSVDYLIVAGGGGGGNFGGGGAGGLLTTYTPVTGTTPGQSQTQISLTVGTTYTITIGDGGAGNTGYGSLATSGDDSTISGSDITTITATGGGAGNKSSSNTTGIDGGSGGGSGWNFSSAPAGSATPTGQGFDGGTGANNDPSPSDFLVGGGGGGASATPATPSVSTVPGAGGEGTTIDITGSSVGYAGGGGGVGFYSGNGSGAAPATGGGGAGSNWGGVTSTLSPVYAGTDGKGGGGGCGGDGGCGIIYIRLPGITSGDVTILSGSAAKGNVSSDAFVKLDTAGTATFKITSNGETSTTGTLRENTTTGKMEIYTGDAGWRALQQTDQVAAGVVPSNNFNAVIYTGNGSTQSITDVGFQPDLSWIKARNGPGQPTLFDSVRGVEQMLESNSTASEQNYPGYGLTAFNNNGFTVVDQSNGGYRVNGSSGGTYSGTPPDYVSWNWKAGGTPTVSNPFMIDDVGYASAALASMNTGTITPTEGSVNTEAGFSIVQYTGTSTSSQSFSHGLGNVPDCIMIKKLGTGAGNRDWVVYHKDLTSATYEVYLNRDIPEYDSTGGMFASTPTSAVVNIGSEDYINESAISYIAYSWCSIPNYSLIGGYKGTGVVGHTPAQLGFNPAWLMIKSISTGDWNIFDNKRKTGIFSDELMANSSGAEVTGTEVVLLENTFQLNSTSSELNSFNVQYIFICFAA